ncbi:AAA family ATPase [Arthrobacter sp. Hor0625]|uniref:AAA family ATPase n=1 Tax=Arthrobacter sp. Hor0625 TaxID=3457358 RepID=UPI00403E659B
MSTTAPIVHLLCGLNGAGKTTVAKRLEATLPAVRFSLDDWMLRLHPGLHYASDEYARRAEECKVLMWDIAVQVLRTGTDVVLDWNQWNRERRARWRDNAREAGFGAVLHHVQTPLGVAIERTLLRTLAAEPGTHPLTEAAVRHLAGIFEEPDESEGVRILRVDGP